MLVLADQLTNTPIVSVQTNGRIGTLGKPIIDPRNLKVVAFYVSSSAGEVLVVHTSDIRQIANQGVVVDGPDNLMELNGLVRLKEVINIDFQLNGKRVVSESKRRLGKVVNYVIETDTFFVSKLHVRQSFMKNMAMNNLVLDHSQIIEVTDRKIVVRDTEERVSNKSFSFEQQPTQQAVQPDTSTPNSQRSTPPELS